MKPNLLTAGIILLVAFMAKASGIQPESYYLQSLNKQFVENRGQIADVAGNSRPDVLYTARVGGVNLFFTAKGVYYVFSKYEKTKDLDGPNQMAPAYRISELYRMDMEWVGANPGVQIQPDEKTQSYSNYYLGHCPEGIERVAHYGKLTYRNIYKGIDLVFYFNKDGNLEYDFVLRPGADPVQIKIKYNGAENISVLPTKHLQVTTPISVLEDAPVVAYQMGAAGRLNVDASYVAENGQVSYRLGAYNNELPVIIDPMQRSWATYIGGNADDYLFGGRSDASDNVYITFYSGSTNLPTTTGAYQTSSAGAGDTYVAKFNSSGSLSWATYYGGTGAEQGQTIAVDKNGNVFNAGLTSSTDFPVTSGAFQSSQGGGQDAFILKLNSSGTRQWATYIGGSKNDVSQSVTTDTAGAVYIGGYTLSSNFPVSTGAFQTSIGSTTYQDGFLAKFSSSGARLWSTYIGGSNNESTDGLSIDTLNNVWLTGYTASSNFPVTSGASQSSSGGGIDGFIANFSSSGSRKYSTYYGGTSDDAGREANAVSGYIYVTGFTQSSNFPVSSGAWQSSAGGAGDAFLLKFDMAGKRVWATYLGGNGYDENNKLSVDRLGDIWFSGLTASTNFPTTSDAFQATKGGGYDAFLVAFNPADSMIYSTYYGGTADELGYSVSAAGKAVYLFGSSQSTNLPVTSGAYQSTKSTSRDGFIVKFIEQQDTPKVAAKLLKLTTKCASVTVTCTKGDGQYRLVIGREGKAPDKLPGNKPYKANAAFGKGDDLGNGNYAMYSDTGDTFTATGLTPGKTYYFTVYEFNMGLIDAYYLKKNNPVDSVKSPLMTVGFTMPDSNFCLGEVFDLTNTSSVTSGTLSYTWYFGDGTKSTAMNPSVKYGSTGTFEIKLKVLSDKGCIDSVVQKVNINPIPKAAFVVNSSSQCFPGHQFAFTNQTTIASGAVSYLWNFGDDSSSTLKSPVHSYAVPGDYDVKLVVKSGSGCSDSIMKKVTVIPAPVAGFTINKDEQCIGANNFIFTDNSSAGSGSLTYQWDFGDGGTSSIQNPSHTYISTGIFNVKLSVKSDKGCTDTLSKKVTIDSQPVADFEVNQANQCLADNQYVFKDKSSSSTGALNYNWDFGDGNGSAAQNPTYTYTIPGIYIVKLSVSTNAGCEESKTITIHVYPAVKASFSTGNTCMFSPVSFTSTSLGNVSKYTWDFGDSSFSNAKSPKHSYSARGVYKVSLLITSSDGCTDSKTGQIEIFDPSADFTFKKLTDSSYKFSPADKNLISWNWSFGDGQSSTDSTPVHIFKKSGQYTVKFIAGSAGGCVDSSKESITIQASGIFEVPRSENRFAVYPNPFNDHLTISYSLTEKSLVTLELMDILGREIVIVANNQLQASGAHEFIVDKASINASSGLLFVRLTIDGQSYMKKVIVTEGQ